MPDCHGQSVISSATANRAEQTLDQSQRPRLETPRLMSATGTDSRKHSAVSKTRQSQRSRSSEKESLASRRCHTENGQRRSWSDNAATRRRAPSTSSRRTTTTSRLRTECRIFWTTTAPETPDGSWRLRAAARAAAASAPSSGSEVGCGERAGTTRRECFVVRGRIRRRATPATRLGETACCRAPAEATLMTRGSLYVARRQLRRTRSSPASSRRPTQSSLSRYHRCR